MHIPHVLSSCVVSDRAELPYHLSTSDKKRLHVYTLLFVSKRMHILHVLSSCVVSDRAELPYHLSASDTNDCVCMPHACTWLVT